MTLPFTLSIEFDADTLDPSQTPTFRAGELIKGRVLVRTTRSMLCRGLHAYQRWQTKGSGNPHEGNKTRKVVFAGHWRADARHVYPFRFVTPAWPVSHDGEHVSVEHTIGVECAAGSLGTDPAHEVTERTIRVVAGPDTFKHLETLAPTHTGATHNMGGGLCCSSLGLGAGLAILGLTSTAPYADAIGLGIVGTLVVLAAVLGVVVSVRNFLAERRIGCVFVGLSPTVHAGRELRCLVRFQPAVNSHINSIEATLVGTERARLGSGKNSRRFVANVYKETLLLSPARTLAAGEVFEEEKSFPIAEDAAPSLSMGSNTIAWKLRLRVDVADWPDWVHSYPIQVTPPGLFSVNAKARVRISSRVQPSQLCPYCRDGVSDEDPEALVTCAGCGTVIHKECMREFGRCSTAGCRRSGLRA